MTVLSDQELMQIRRKGDVAKENLEILKPYFALLRDHIHEKWESLMLDDGQGAKMLKFQLKAVIELERAMMKDIDHGKQASHKLKETK